VQSSTSTEVLGCWEGNRISTPTSVQDSQSKSCASVSVQDSQCKSCVLPRLLGRQPGFILPLLCRTARVSRVPPLLCRTARVTVSRNTCYSTVLAMQHTDSHVPPCVRSPPPRCSIWRACWMSHASREARTRSVPVRAPARSGGRGLRLACILAGVFHAIASDNVNGPHPRWTLG
jgi:hypothetical protein